MSTSKFKTTIFAAVASALLMSASVSYAADIPSRKYAPVAPVEVVSKVPSFYVGVNAGMLAAQNTTGTAGVVAGYNFNQNIAGELSYDYAFASRDVQANHLVLGNVLVGQQFGVVKPYVLAGVGYSWRDTGRNGFSFGRAYDSGRAVFALGGGVKFEVASNWEVDGRYRYVQAFDNSEQTKPDNRLTMGVNFKF